MDIIQQNKVRFADVNILIRSDFSYSLNDRFIPYRSEFDKPDITYDFVTVTELPQPETEPIYYDGMISVYREGGVIKRYYSSRAHSSGVMISDAELELGRYIVYAKKGSPELFKTELKVFDHIAIEHAMALFGGAILHSSFIIHEGKAILFTAPSQTGKSTQAELWRRHKGADVINGDRSLVKLKDGVLHAYSLPYCGTSNICRNRFAPIRAVVVLSQASFNRLSVMRPSIAFRHIYEGFAVNIWYDDDVKTVTDITESIIKTVPVYLLECLPNVDAVDTLAAALEE